MKAMILAAGLGTRLLPHTRLVPKPLFQIKEKPILEILIEKLIRAGCSEIMINTHHLSEQIEFFLKRKQYHIPIKISYEPEILGTGGAIKNVEQFWDDAPFMVINSDVVTDIDLKMVYGFHLNHPFSATLVLTDCTQLNTVSTDSRGFIIDFSLPENRENDPLHKRFTFTGIQVLDKKILDDIPEGVFYSIIDAYNQMIKTGNPVKAFYALENYWKDIGTVGRYREAVLDDLIPEAFYKAFSQYPSKPVSMTCLKGDGSDRRWFRLRSENTTLILADHGIHENTESCETNSFIKIGNHLYARKAPVPQIFHKNIFSGHVIMEDLGNTLLQHEVINYPDQKRTQTLYKKIIKKLCHMWIEGAKGFDTSWTYQTTHYDRHVILENECRYFSDAFLKGYLGLNIGFEDLSEDFYHLADRVEEFAGKGFMHRDFQSRNIMLNGPHIFFIDFQGGRLGPIQYDLASLLIDPYTALSETLQMQLLEFCVHYLDSLIYVSYNGFKKGFHYCALARNLQILGAFAHLSLNKKKTWFEKYIPRAIKTLKKNLDSFFEESEFRFLKEALKNC
jgi:aminoglycoside/choline kinase family phosphotransferase/dTDP-glucose pyrophosphorylase